MSTKATTLVAVAAFAATGFFAGYVVKGRAAPPPTGHETVSREATVPLADHQRVVRELEEARARGQMLEREIAAVQREAYRAPASEGEEAAEGAAKLRGPRFVYSGTMEALNAVDWETVAESLHAMPPLLEELAEALESGGALPPSVGEIQRWNGPLLKEAIKLQQAGVGGMGLNSVFSNPTVMVNMVHAALAKSDAPLSEEQEQRLYEIGLRYADEERRRADGYDEAALGIRKLVDETALKDRFFAEVQAVLGPQQHATLRPEATRGRAGLDLFSTGVMYSGLARPVPARDAADFEQGLVKRVMDEVQLDAAQRAAVEDAARRYVQDLPEGFLDVPMPSGPLPLIGMDRVRLAARLQARLMEDLAGRLALTETQRAKLRSEIVVLVPYAAP